MNIMISKDDKNIAYFLSRMTDFWYRQVRNIPTFKLLMEEIINLGGDIYDPYILKLCLSIGAIGGILTLDEFRAIKPEHKKTLMRYIEPSNTYFVNIIEIFMKYMEFDNKDVNKLFKKLIKYNYRIHDTSGTEYYTKLERFFELTQNYGYVLHITGKNLQMFIDNRIQSRIMKLILENVEIVEYLQIYDVNDSELYNLLTNFGISVELLETTNTSDIDSDSDGVLVG